MTSPTAIATDSSFFAVQRRLAATLRDTGPVGAPRPLEVQSRGVQEAPSLRQADVIEDDRFRARAVGGSAPAHFNAFLDGSQHTLVVRWDGMVPIVFGTVAAVIRRRRERRLTTWNAPIVQRALYAPLRLLTKEVARALAAAGVGVVDTMARRDPESTHPFALQEIAYQAVLSDRERIEQQLTGLWCAAEPGVLFVDGGISGNETVARAINVVGVVKSHQTVHVGADDLGVLTALRPGERSSVLRIDAARRASVASWYLRTSDAAGHDPLWGLVRVEVALEADAKRSAITRHADDVSRWVLAERLPLSVPDPRWDRMAYGIRDAEEYLQAVR